MSDLQPDSTNQRFKNGHACVIGIGGEDLPGTTRDAQRLAEMLKDPERCAYPEEQVQLLTGEQATRPAIMNALQKLASTTNANSSVLIYFSGHGYQLLKPFKIYYLMPHGYNTEDLAETAISGIEFRELLEAIPAKQLLVILDCCHAGGLTDLSGFKVTKAPLPPEALKIFGQGSGRMMIASSQENELSYAGDGNDYSPFTFAILRGLCGKGVSKQDGYIRSLDLAMYAREIVPKLTDEQQHPVVDIQQADNFILGYYAAGGRQPKGLPGDLEQEPKPASTPGANTPAPHIRTTIASGPGSVAIGGNSTNNTIITGNNNILGNNNRVQNVTQRGKYNINLGSAQNFHIGDKFGDDDEDEE